MKKLLVLILAAAMLLSLFSCTNNNSGGGLFGDLLNNALNDDYNSGNSNNNKVLFGGKATSYAHAYEQLSKIQEDMNELLTKLNDKHNEGLDYGDDGFTGIYYFLVLLSMDLAFTATLSEENYEYVAMAYSWMGFEAFVTRPRANEYIISYKTEDGDSYVQECKFDTSTGSLSFVSKENGAISNFYEFVNLGSDKYAFQTKSERAVVTYKDGVVLNLAYSSYNPYSDDKTYDPSKDGIYPGKSVDANWVFADGIDSYRNAYQYDGSALKINTNPEWSDGVSIEIPAK